MPCDSHVKQKASIWTPFVFLALVISSAPLYANNCAVSEFHETVQVDRVYDGDTIKLVDGRKLRLIGINTPERGRDGKRDEPLYQEAKSRLQQIIKNNKNKIKIVFGKDRQDRYKRFLTHIFSIKNENITASLIKEGLGYTIAVPPNIQLLLCYQNAEREAKKHKHGIWGHNFSQPTPVASLKKSARGFHRISGTVQRIGESRSSFWLNLNSNSGTKFALRVLKKDLQYFINYHPKELLNRKLIARGWIYEINNEQRMTVHHPASLQVQSAD